MLKHKLFTAYLVFGIIVSVLFGVAAASGMQLPKGSGSSGYRSSGRSYGGSWGGGK